MKLYTSNFKIAISQMPCPYCVFLGICFRLIGRQYTSAKRHFHNKNGRNFLSYIFHLKTKFGMYVKTVKVAES
jgi:hypothetical protein